MKNEVKCCGIALSTKECFADLVYGRKKMDRLCDIGQGMGVYSDDARGYQILIFRHEENRDLIFDQLDGIGFHDFCKLDNLYVHEKYAKGVLL